MPQTPKSFGRAVIIGLGGTGQKALLRIKKLFYDHCDGVLPPSVILLAFDTDAKEAPTTDARGRKVELDDNEYCRLSVNKVREAVTSPYVQDWWIPYPALDTCAIADGAGGIRQAGRLALFSCIDRVKHRIESAYNEMNAFGSAVEMQRRGFELRDGSAQVIVIGSLAGGTGGGLFVDMSVLCRNLGGQASKYMAFVMMPWVYRDKANSAYENTYAGLIELNHLLQLTPQSPMVVRYSDTLECKLEESPFHIINLVDGQCDSGELIPDDKVLNTFIAEAVYHLTGAIGKEARSVYDNIIALKLSVAGSGEWSGESAVYSTIGVSAIRYPAREIHQSIAYRRMAEVLRLIARDNAKPDESKGLQVTDELRKECEAFLQQNVLTPTDTGILARLLPGADRPYLEFDDEELANISTRDEVISDLARRKEEQRKAAVSKLEANSPSTVPATVESLSGLLMRIGRATNDGQMAAGSMMSAVAWLRGQFRESRNAVGQIVEESKKQESEADLDTGRAKERIPEGNTVWFKIIGMFASRTRNYVRAVNEDQQAFLRRLAAQEAMRVYQQLEDWLDQHAQESISLCSRLGTLAHQYDSRAVNLSLPRLAERKTRFEYLLGIDDTLPSELPHYYQQFDNKAKAAEDLKRQFDSDAELQLATVQSLDAARFQEFERSLLSKIETACAVLLDVSVIDVLREKQQKAKDANLSDPVPELLRRSLDQATLLLPLRKDLLAFNNRSIKEFLILGLGHINRDGGAGATDDTVTSDRAHLTEGLPDEEKRWLAFANTEDPYRITVTHYKAVFPLHAIQGLETLRAAYNERVHPPSHVNRKWLFNLDDPLPQDAAHTLALKLLTLAMLDYFGLIKHRHKDYGGSYFIPVESLYDFYPGGYDIETKLPGKPGKFYSLAEEIVKFPQLMGGLKAMLIGASPRVESLDNFFARVDARQKRFQAIVENMRRGAERREVTLPGENGEEVVKAVFNKTVTGNLYRRQAAFLDEVRRGRGSLTQQVQKGNNLIEIICHPGSEYQI